MEFFKKVLEKMSMSAYDKFGKMSHIRVSSYIVLFPIIINSCVFMCIEMLNVIKLWHKDEAYVIPVSHITIFGMILAHHISILFYKNVEAKNQTSIALKEAENKTVVVVQPIKVEAPVEEPIDDKPKEELG